MNILFVTSLFPSPIDPLHGIFKKHIAGSLSKNHKVIVLRPVPYFPKWISLFINSNWNKYGKIPKQYEIDGLVIYAPRYLWLPGMHSSMHPVLMKLGIQGTINRLHNNYQFDVINTHWFHPDAVAVSNIAKKLKISHVPTACGSDVNKNILRSERINRAKQIKNMLSQTQHITVVAGELRQLIQSKLFSYRNIHVIPNGVNKKEFFPEDKFMCRKLLGIFGETKICLYIGRLSEEKNVRTLIRAFPKVNDSLNDSHLYIIGSGIEGSNLKSIVSDYDITDCVTFVGNVDHNKIGKWIAASDCLCLPSNHEGCPNVVLETLSSGRPVVGSYAGAIPELLTRDTGILFNANDVDALSTALIEALTKDWDYQKISESMDEFTWDNTAKKYVRVFEMTIKQ